MIFSLEVLEAKHGDCLLLHYGEITNPSTIVIDGGPAGVYRENLKPRLKEIKDNISQDRPLRLSMVMVSHLDDDHVNGILQLTDDIDDEHEFEVKDLWVNTFDDIIGNIQLPVISGVSASNVASAISTLPIDQGTEPSIAAVIASTGQGRKLRDIATKLHCRVNHPFKNLNGKSALVRGDTNQKPIGWGDLRITIIHPDEQRLVRLQKQWDDDLMKAKAKGDNTIIFASLTSPDTSPFNLSSIVCLVELEGKKILLTGDGRSDDIYDGLKLNKLVDPQGSMHVDILKMPHHGSIRNMKNDFLEKVTADHYVISADGNNDNPDEALLALFVDTVKNGTLHLTNQDGKQNLKKKLDRFTKNLQAANSKVKVEFLKGKPIVIDLLEGINF